jgi:hypothetical protein
MALGGTASCGKVRVHPTSWLALTALAATACKPAWVSTPPPEAVRYIGCYRVEIMHDSISPPPTDGATPDSAERTQWRLTTAEYPRARNRHRRVAFQAIEVGSDSAPAGPTSSAAWRGTADSLLILAGGYGWRTDVRLTGHGDTLYGRGVSTTHMGWFAAGRALAVRERCRPDSI